MSKDYRAVGIHVFAGGFTSGVMKHDAFDVQCQLETFNLGEETVTKQLGIPFIRSDNFRDWPRLTGQFAYGNPRCTAFSCMTSNCSSSGHGAFAKQTVDILQLSEYAVGNFDVIAFESVQQCYTTGRPLLDHICEQYYFPAGYRIAHLLLNAASFGNVQQRKRYFFVAYRDHLKFNIVPPQINPYYGVLWDAIGGDKSSPEECYVIKNKHDTDYDGDSVIRLTKNEYEVLDKIPNGWNLNTYARFNSDTLPDELRIKWETRTSELPFSLHCIARTNWFRPSPTLAGTAGRLLHPEYHRPLSVKELSLIMGWDYVPRGPLPVQQIAKGICPCIGTWLAEQVKMCLNDEWGGEDFESSYNAAKAVWEGRDTPDEREKVFRLTSYVGKLFSMDRYPDVLVQMHKHNIDTETGRPRRRLKDLIANAHKSAQREKEIKANANTPTLRKP